MSKVLSLVDTSLLTHKVNSFMPDITETKYKFGFLEYTNYLLNQYYCSYCKEYVTPNKKGTHKCSK